MVIFRLLLVCMLISLIFYTGTVISNHGINLLTVFFGDMLKIGWPGQFNLDFMFMLTLSAIWVAWRHKFSAQGALLAVCALFGGSLFLSVYLLILSWQSKGDVRQLLIGTARIN